jgi:hypothetical protein
MDMMIRTLTLLASNLMEGVSDAYVPVNDLKSEITNYSLRIIAASSVLLLILTLLAALFRNSTHSLKLPLFVMMATIILSSTVYLTGVTIYLHNRSDSGGPVYHEAGIEIWACGNELELKDPSNWLSGKIGSSSLYERNDKTIHLDGIVFNALKDASLGKFFYDIGGTLTQNALVVPLNDDRLFENNIDGDGPADAHGSLISSYLINDDTQRYAKFINGGKCKDEKAFVQVFVYKFDQTNNTYRQSKVIDPANYSLTQSSNSDLSDCVIIEYDTIKNQTTKLCQNYGQRDVERCRQFGIGSSQTSSCNIQQIEYPLIDPNYNHLDPTSIPTQYLDKPVLEDS